MIDGSVPRRTAYILLCCNPTSGRIRHFLPIKRGFKVDLSSDREPDRPIGVRPVIGSRIFYCTRGPKSDRNDQPFRENVVWQLRTWLHAGLSVFW
jgi:hypothetical protein